MRRLIAAIALALCAALPATAALSVGARAPDFSAPSALAGKTFSFSLAASLARGPMVVYFFPAAFTKGCSIEAHEFAEAMPQFEALGAGVIGVSTDNIETLAKFSVEACQSRFPVASDGGRTVVKAYDAQLAIRPDYADRISYLIAPDGTIVASYASPNPDRHVEKMLAALRDWRQAQPRK
ncbi:MAG TPA: peroxiredoxin [Burkholderiaceae bacterium]|nr:peroxiredoxin [Burkholderiaceae bacterium]